MQDCSAACTCVAHGVEWTIVQKATGGKADCHDHHLSVLILDVVFGWLQAAHHQGTCTNAPPPRIAGPATGAPFHDHLCHHLCHHPPATASEAAIAIAMGSTCSGCNIPHPSCAYCCAFLLATSTSRAAIISSSSSKQSR